MEPLDLERHMTWVVRYCSNYESDWMALHRFLWMNAITGEDLWRALSGRDFRELPVGKGVPGRFVKLIHDSPYTKEFSRHLRARSLQECFGPGNAGEMEQIARIRFCPLCLGECFHSPLFQLASVEECPVHGISLRNTCEHCANALGDPVFEPRTFNVPLGCPHCGRSFFREDAAENALAGFASGEAAFRRVERWMKLLRVVQFEGTRGLDGEPWQPGDYRTICDCLVRLAVHSSRRAPWPEPPATCKVVERRVRSELSLSERFARERMPTPLNDDFERASVIARSINRHLSGAVRRVCGHRQTVQLRRTNANRPFEPVQPLLLMSPLDCPCCAVLDRWRAYAGKLIALRNIARRMRSIGHIYDQFDTGYRSMLQLEPGECAKALITSFTWFAVAMDRLLEELARQEDGTWYPLEGLTREAMMRQRALAMDVYRFDLEPHVYVFSMGEEEVSMAYSLEYAFEALRRCAARRRKAPLWPSPHVREPTDPYPGRDKWYVRMSEDLNSGRGARLWVTCPSPLPDSMEQGELFPKEEGLWWRVTEPKS